MNRLNFNIDYFDLKVGHILQSVVLSLYTTYKENPVDKIVVEKWLDDFIKIMNIPFLDSVVTVSGKTVTMKFTVENDKKEKKEIFAFWIDLTKEITSCVKFISGETVIDDVNIYQIIYTKNE